MDTSPPTAFRIKDLPPEIFKLVMKNVDRSALVATRSTCKYFKEETDDRFDTTFLTDLESNLTQSKLESLLWLSQQSRPARHIKSLLFAIDDDYTAEPHHRLINRIINNLNSFSSSVTLGVASQQWNHADLWEHCRDMDHFLNFSLVPLRHVINVNTWKIVVRIHDLRGTDWTLQDCFSEIGEVIGGVVSGNVTLRQGINLEIHDGAGDPVRHVQVTNNGIRHGTLKNFDCEMLDNYNRICSLEDAAFTDLWKPKTLTIKDSVFLQETLRLSINRNPFLRHLIIENVRVRREFDPFDDVIEPADWIETLQMLQLGHLDSCRLVNLRDGNDDFFVEGVWEFTATPYRSVSNAIAGLIENVQRARSLKDEAEAQ
ncbi:hypothetical protein KCU95_g3344, partial [Aureobasidium melanogenum]